MASFTAEDLEKDSRTFHGTESVYFLPNDSVEHRRLELQSSLMTDLMGGHIIHAPVSRDATKALDIGCGTGSVTHKLAVLYPKAAVYGVDLSAVPRHLRRKRPNLDFVQADINQLVHAQESGTNADMRFSLGTFDICFSRLLMFGKTDWQSYIGSVANMLKRGGWAEMHEPSYIWSKLPSNVSIPPETVLPHNLPVGSDFLEQNVMDFCPEANTTDPYAHQPRSMQVLNKAMRAKKLDPTCGSNIALHMHRAGFVDIRIRRYIWASTKIFQT